MVTPTGMVQEDQGYSDRDADEVTDRRRDWRQRDDVVEHQFREITKRLDKIEKTLEERRCAVDSALKRLEDLYEALFKEPNGEIYKLKKRNVDADIRHLNLKYIYSLGLSALGLIAAILGAGDKIKAFLKNWLT